MIAVCVPWVKVDPAKKFLPHWMEFYAINREKHGLRQHFQMYRPLNEVQEETVDMARVMKATHILFVEDDHWGFPVDGIEILLEADKDAIGFQTLKKKFPYPSLAMRKLDKSKSLIGRKDDLLANKHLLLPHERRDGEEVQETDLITWAFTLVRMSVFDRLREAGKHPFEQFGPVPTDSFFNQYCEDIGILRHVHFGFTIAHGEHDPVDIPLIREVEKRVILAKKNKDQLEDIRNSEPPSTELVAEHVRAFHERLKAA